MPDDTDTWARRGMDSSSDPRFGREPDRPRADADADVAAKLAAASSALREARAMRSLVAEALVEGAEKRLADRPDPWAAASAHREPAPQEPASRRPLALLGAALALALVAVVVLVATRPSGEPGDRTSASAPAPAAPPAARELIPCSRVPADARTAQCFTGTRLAIASGDAPLEVGETTVRLTQAAREGAAIALTLRMRNGTRQEAEVRPGAGRVYLSLAGRRITAAPGPAGTIAAGAEETLRLRFELDPAAIGALDAAGGKVDVGVVPLGEPVTGRPPRVGVIRATVG